MTEQSDDQGRSAYRDLGLVLALIAIVLLLVGARRVAARRSPGRSKDAGAEPATVGEKGSER